MGSGRLFDKVAVVTGSSSGIGRAISIRYAQEGARVVCADLQPSARQQVQSETNIATHELIQKEGGKAIFVQTDVSEAKQVESLIQAAVKKFGRVDILVNNAGIALESRNLLPVHKTDESVWDKTMKVNAKSVFLGCKYALNQMLLQEPHSSGDKGWIINIASVLGLGGNRATPSYSTSKGAVITLTKQVAIDYASERIHCNVICPGYIDTAILVDTVAQGVSRETLNEKHPLKGVGKADDVAKIAVNLASDDAGWVTGVVMPVDGGYAAHL